jgi:hypothetical protein
LYLRVRGGRRRLNQLSAHAGSGTCSAALQAQAAQAGSRGLWIDAIGKLM